MGITMKSTKQEIMDAYLEAKKVIDELNNMKDDPVALAKEEKNKEIIASANEISAEGILNPSIVEKYNNLLKAIDMKKEELRNLYGIEAEANALVAIVNAHKDKLVELEEHYKENEEALKATAKATRAAFDEEVKKLKDDKEKMISSLEAKYEETKKQLELERKREEEEYLYNLNRLRQKDEDMWNDEKYKREKELSNIEGKITELESKAEYISTLEKMKEDLPNVIENAKAEGYKEGKADADKSNVFEVRALKKENEYQIKILEDKLSRAEMDLSSIREEKVELQNKLDEAYRQMRELAARTVESTGGVKILNSANTSQGK